MTIENNYNKEQIQRTVAVSIETTGFSPYDGSKIIEIGCVELVNKQITKQLFHTYIQPEKTFLEVTTPIHGITNSMVSDAPTFFQIVDEFLSFIEGSLFVCHNAHFVLGFLNEEISLCGEQEISPDQLTDILPLYIKKFPGQTASLGNMCSSLGLEVKQLTEYGTVSDANIIASIYLELIGQTENKENVI